MNLVLAGLVGLVLLSLLIAFYMDWLGLWVSKQEQQEEMAAASKRTRERRP